MGNCELPTFLLLIKNHWWETVGSFGGTCAVASLGRPFTQCFGTLRFQLVVS